MTPRWSVTWSAFWPGLAASTGSGVWWQTHGETAGQPQKQADEGCGEVTSRDRVLALARHPSFTSVVAGRVVRELGWEELVDVWDETGRLLARPANPRHLLNYVRVRAAVLDELESRSPRKFQRWYVRQWESLGQRHRTGG